MRISGQTGFIGRILKRAGGERAFFLLAFSLCVAGGLTQEVRADTDNDQGTERGAYLTAAGGCYGCHTDIKNDGKPYAGGRALETPFGTFYTPNITADRINGIGSWTDNDFLRALKRGISPSGHYYFPAFPYPSYTKMKDEDALAIKSYLLSLEPVAAENKPHEIAAPFSWRWLQWGWRILFFEEEPYQPPSGASEAVARGGYLVDALTHCGECHTPRNALGGPDSGRYLAGTPNGPDGERVPNITPDSASGIGDWSEGDIVTLLRDGMKPDFDNVQGSMAEAIEHGLSHLTDEDLAAIAAYLKSIPAIATGGS
ncbi:MAG: diheme cytochrome C-type [Sneathiella sp.]|jgi:mono/diheme cytochrome c family protein|uniref:c-type cytochrome n=1 Tax=Sneathiella sp. TaxID=1964365 RepID=UPI000C612EA1|nr:cytochrome c [Sneathiella sp.]MAL80647.1 diheme cytochrome C-type [Sneathiella sp.]|tara:strand:- start:731 stop:1672 length:942 start_codon:yes stop_codon:yes gene_type:complete